MGCLDLELRIARTGTPMLGLTQAAIGRVKVLTGILVGKQEDDATGV